MCSNAKYRLAASLITDNQLQIGTEKNVPVSLHYENSLFSFMSSEKTQESTYM